MSKHLVLVVHGIGEQNAGETLDQFVGAAAEAESVEVDVEANVLQLSEENDGFATPPRADLSAAGNVRLFPCHTRRVTRAAGNGGPPEAIMAEVHWADLSPAPSGFVRTSLDVLRLILGLGHLALDNLRSNPPVWGPLAVFQRWLVTSVVWIMQGPIAALNVLLLLGALFLLVDPLLFRIGTGPGDLRPEAVLGILGAVAGAAGIYFRRKAATLLTRSFLSALCLLGGLTLVAALVDGLAGPICSGAADVPIELAAIDCYVGSVIRGLELTWVAALIGATVLGIVALVTRRWHAHPTAILYPGICAGIMVLWMIATSMFWVGAQAMVERTSIGLMQFQVEQRERQARIEQRIQEELTVEDITRSLEVEGAAAAAGIAPPGERLWRFTDIVADKGLLLHAIFNEHFRKAIQTISFAAVAFLAICVAGFAITAARQVRLALDRRRLRRSEAGLGAARSPVRIILNPVLNTALQVSVVVLVLGALYVSSDTDGDGAVTGVEALAGPLGLLIQEGGWLKPSLDRIDASYPFVVMSLIALGLVFYNTHSFIASALGIVRDIVVYSARDDRGFLWHVLPDLRRPPENPDYPLRQRIERRFHRVLEHMLAVERPDMLTVVSHSQGTVLAVRSLSNPSIQAMVRAHVGSPRLITMGSPVSHIYGTYFARDFTVERGLTGFLHAWVNIYRVDDFVGTTVELSGARGSPDWPGAKNIANLPVPAAGHTGYWTDRDVWRQLRGSGGFALFPGAGGGTAAQMLSSVAGAAAPVETLATGGGA